MYEDPKSKISQLGKVLDAREDRVTKKIKRHELHDHESNIPEDWDDSATESGEEIVSSPTFSGSAGNLAPQVKKKMSWEIKVLLGSVIFFVIALLAVAYKFLGGGIIVSGDNIEVTVKAPVSIAGGEVLPVEIEVKNNNSVKLVGADLAISFPSGTMQADNISIPLKRSQLFLGDIDPGKSVKKSLKVVLFGSENEKKNIALALEYKVTGSNSLFNKKKDVPVLITSAPVSLVVTGPSDINTNQTVSFDVEITSNSTSVIKDVLLVATYPFGFTFSNSSPNTFAKNNLWLIGDLVPGEKRNVKITGNVSGQEGEERGFNFTLGNQSKTDLNTIETPFNTSFSSVTIRRPFVSADLYLDESDAAEHVAVAGAKIKGVVKWKNNLSYQVSNVSIIVKLTGNALDKSSVEVDDGFYRSVDNVIIFDKSTDPVFASLDPGQDGESEFEIKSFSPTSITGSALSNPVIIAEISAQGKVTGDTNQSENVSFFDFRKIKITSDPSIFAKALYYVGSFQNKGAIPPKAEAETTYTVTWTVTNPLNGLSGARVSAVLPPYVKWLEVVSPSSEKMSYDANTREVIWSLGNISAGAGNVSPAREVSFQISFLPSVSQIGEVPPLVGVATLSARDIFTSAVVSSSFAPVTTNLSSDPYFKSESGKVVK
jgi:hypothetical protein